MNGAFDENVIIDKAVLGDKAAFGVLYSKYKNDIFFFFLSRINSREDALDLTSEVFIKVIKGLKNFKKQSSFKTWLYVITRNILNDFLRGKYERLEDPADEEFVDNVEEILESDGVENDQKMVIIRDIFNKLPDNYKSILELRYLLNYSFRECAEALGITENNAKVLHNRALKKAKFVSGVTEEGLGM